MDKLQDPAIIEGLRNGSHQAYTHLFEHYWKMVFNAVFRKTGNEQVALDITQEIFCMIWEKRAQLEIKGPIAHWLSGVIKYKVIDWFRESARHLEQKEQLLARLLHHQPASIPPEELLLNYDKTYTLWLQCVNQLPEQMKKIYLLSKMEGRSIGEIAGLLSIKPQSVKNHLQRATDRVYEQMKTSITISYSALLIWSLL